MFVSDFTVTAAERVVIEHVFENKQQNGKMAVSMRLVRQKWQRETLIRTAGPHLSTTYPSSIQHLSG